MAFVLIGVLVVAGAMMLWLPRHGKSFPVAAKRLNLAVGRTLPDLRPRIEGMIDNLPVKVDIVVRRHPVVRYRVWHAPLRLGLRLRRESTISRAMTRVGTGDIRVADGAFDDAFIVKTVDPERLRRFLTPARRASLIRLIAAYPRITVDDTGITLVGTTAEPTADVIVSTIRRMAATASRLTGATDDTALEDSIVARERGNLAEAAELLQGRATVDDDVDSAIHVAETLLVTDQTEAAGVVIDELRDRLPADPELAGLEVTPPAVAPEMVGDEFFEQLFGADQLSFESSGRFEKNYRGMRVRWSGTVKDAREYAADLDFPGASGTKAIITVAHVQNDLYGATEIDAVVRLELGDAARLEPGRQVTFTGTLRRIDPFMRKVYVRGGTLVEDWEPAVTASRPDRHAPR